jgi:hypothetical protein
MITVAEPGFLGCLSETQCNTNDPFGWTLTPHVE